MSTMLTIAEVLGGIVGYAAITVVVSATFTAKAKTYDERQTAPLAGAFWPLLPLFFVVSAAFHFLIEIPVGRSHDKLVAYLTRPKLPKARKIERLKQGD